MDRRDFLKNGTALSLGTAFFSSIFTSCGVNNPLFPTFNVNFDGKVIIVGAGAAGLTAGYLLHQYGIDFEILEASAIYGGRVKKIDDFADFPIDLGGEWIHTNPDIFSRLVSDESINEEIETIVYNPQSVYVWKNGALRKRSYARHFYSEYKFKNTTWFDFLTDYIVKDIGDKITYNSPVTTIDYSSDKVNIQTSDNSFECDKVILTVPVPIMKNNFINFIPSLSQAKIDAFNTIDIPDGLKVFIEFSERFYHDIVAIDSLFGEYEKLYYDAAFRKDSERNVLGLFTVGTQASALTSLSDEEIFEKVMSELDEIFDGKASETYIQHIVQNWSSEPYIQGSYSFFQENYYATIATIVEPIMNKIYFAGEAYNQGDNTSTVHGAAESAYSAVKLILK